MLCKVSFWVVAVLLMCIGHGAFGETVCERFKLPGCDLLGLTTPAPTTPSPASQVDNEFCQIACVENLDLYQELCGCGITTTPIPTTTPAPEECYYSLNRSATLGASLVKRLFSPTAVPTECDYPGIIGLFRNDAGTLTMICTGLLLDEQTILVEKFCMNFISNYVVYAHSTSYSVSDLSTSSPTVVASTASNLLGPDDTLQTVQLSSPLTFDDRCVQPICYPNAAITASDIDFTDCRVVGYGYINDNNDQPSVLMEITGYVKTGSITTATLNFQRNDGQTGKMCFNDNTAPLICTHLKSGEYVTVGVAIAVGYTCSTQDVIKSKFANVLQESSKKAYFNNLNKFAYANRA